jgi:tetratricopeptide (TPR) repeat protein
VLSVKLADQEGALVQYRQALALLEPMLRRENTSALTREISDIHTSLGMTNYLLGDSAAALTNYEQALRQYELLHAANAADS